MIDVKEITSKKKLLQFVKFPFDLYKDCKYWVPPLTKDEMETLDKVNNPVFKNAEATYFLAYKEGKIVGRIAVIINHIEINEHTQLQRNLELCLVWEWIRGEWVLTKNTYNPETHDFIVKPICH